MPRAIDVHVHPSSKNYLVEAQGHYAKATEAYFRTSIPVRSEEELAQEFRALDIVGVLLGWDAETNTGLPAVSNDWVAGMVRRFPDTFLGFGGVDPWKGKAAIKEAERCAKELGLRGLKFQQSAQAFFPNDPRFYPLWAKCQELGLVALFHCGTTGLGAGAPGGAGIKLKYTQPLFLDDVAADFPELRIIGAHPAWPWQDEMIAIALHKPNVYIDLSGWSPKYFSPELVREIGGRLQDKALFGTDYPYITPQRWLKDFEELQLKPEARAKILLHNAQRLFGLESSGK